MAVIQAFRAVRPAGDKASLVAALPYDVYSREEAAAAVRGKPDSFLNIDRPETAFGPSFDMYSPAAYDHAAALYEEFKEKGILLKEEQPCLYLYEETMGGHTQTGVAALSSVDDYLNGVCRKHENTVEAKERDRIRHIERLSAQTGPIFLAYHRDAEIERMKEDVKTAEPLYDFVSDDGIRHRVWRIADPALISAMKQAFEKAGCSYIADGHHRAASAVKVALERRAQYPGYTGDEEFNYFLSVLFPETDLKILDYNRVVKTLGGLSPQSLLEAISEKTDIIETGTVTREELEANRVEKGAVDNAGAALEEKLRPAERHSMGLYLDGRTYLLRWKEELLRKTASDPVRSLDVSLLQEEVLSGLLGIEDPRTDRRLSFTGGIAGIGRPVREAADCGGAAFIMYPTSMEELMRVADAGMLMPPKSTWFEPKLRSGLFIHEFER